MLFVSPALPAETHSLVEFEAAFTVIGAALCFAAPRLGAPFFSRLEVLFSRLARRQVLSVVVVGCSALLIRLAILPIHPIPMPFGADDFSNLLAADTFAHGRLTNPTPAMWVHFETIHIDLVPTYMSMYFPAQGLELAAGKVLLGNPWFSVMIGGALMCSALCWMLQGWLPPPWALLGGFLAVMRIALFSYWTSTYRGAGPLCAIGGALVLGSIPRFTKTASGRYLLTMSLGAVILVLSRPYEGLLPLLAGISFPCPLGLYHSPDTRPRAHYSRSACAGSPRSGNWLVGLLRLPGIRKPPHAALHDQSHHLCNCSVLRLAGPPAPSLTTATKRCGASIRSMSWTTTTGTTPFLVSSQ